MPLGVIYGEEIVETGRSDLKMVKKRKNSSFQASKLDIFSSGGARNRVHLFFISTKPC